MESHHLRKKLFNEKSFLMKKFLARTKWQAFSCTHYSPFLGEVLQDGGGSSLLERSRALDLVHLHDHRSLLSVFICKQPYWDKGPLVLRDAFPH